MGALNCPNLMYNMLSDESSSCCFAGCKGARSEKTVAFWPLSFSVVSRSVLCTVVRLLCFEVRSIFSRQIATVIHDGRVALATICGKRHVG